MWVRSSRAEPCVICGRHDWCTRTDDGELAMCMRVESESQTESGGWIHRLSEPLPKVTLPEKPAPKTLVDAEAEARAMFECELAYEYREAVAEQLGLSESVLWWMKVGCGWDEYRSQMFTSWPQRDETGKVIGISRRYHNGEKRTMEGTRGGLTYIRDRWQVGTGPVFLPEGGSDVAALIQIGASAIGRPSNLGGVSMLAKMLRGINRRVVILGERDEKPERKGGIPSCAVNCKGCLHCYPGKCGGENTLKNLRKRLKRVKVDFRLLPAKDARQFVNEGACLFDLLEATK